LEDLKHLLTSQYPRAGVGEIGLDKNKAKKVPFGIQLEIFEAQLQLAIQLDRPCTIHCVNAFGFLVDVLAQTQPPTPIIIHSYSGSGDSIREICRVAPNSYFSVSGQCPRQDIIPFIPMDKLLIETDSPDQCMRDDLCEDVPVPLAEQVNDPSQLPRVAARVARALDIPVADVVRITTQNAIRAFRLD
jgi:TatD DNase family protein